MNSGDRIRLIQRVRDQLNLMPRDDEDLILATFQVGQRPEEDQWGNGPTVTQWLSSVAEDTQLILLAQHLEVLDNEPDRVAAVAEPETPEPLFLFATHLSAHRAFLGEVEEALSRFEIRMFVAHDSIPMDAPWEAEIVTALNDCHAGVVFIHPSLHGSFYCMQEAGWMLGRGIPIARLMFGESPKGLLGAHQGRPCLDQSAFLVAGAIVDWALTHAGLAVYCAESLTRALDGSGGYSETDMVWNKLSRVNEVSEPQLRRILHAAETNHQVYGTGRGGYSGRPYRQVIAQRATEWDARGSLTSRIE